MTTEKRKFKGRKPLYNLDALSFEENDPETGLIYRPETSDLGVIKETASYLRLRPNVSDVILDLGAHIGAAAYRFACCGSAVVSYEPSPSNFSLLSRNLANCDRCQFYNAAVIGGLEDSIILYTSEARGTYAHRTYPPIKGRKEIAVKAINFSKVVREVKPTILKIDVEGEEMRYDFSDLPASVKKISLEVHFFTEGTRKIALKIMEIISAQSFIPVRVPNVYTKSDHSFGIWIRGVGMDENDFCY